MSIKEQILQEYKYRIEAHSHTKPASKCSEVEPHELVKTYAEHGYDAMVLTNHFIHGYIGKDLTAEQTVELYMQDYEKMCIAANPYGMKVFLGAEIRFCQNCNDYLVYGVDAKMLERIYDYLPQGIEAFRSGMNMEKSVFIQAHPFRDGMESVDAALLDGIEVFNMHPGHNSRIGTAARYAAENGKRIITAGSDYHHVGRGHECLCAVRTKTMPEDSFGFAQILNSGDYVLEIGNSIILP